MIFLQLSMRIYKEIMKKLCTFAQSSVVFRIIDNGLYWRIDIYWRGVFVDGYRVVK